MDDELAEIEAAEQPIQKKTAALRRAADEALFWASIKEVVILLADMARHEVAREMGDVGSERQRVRDADDADLGTVSISARRWSAAVTDPAAFVAWVKENRPHELVSVVRDSFVMAMKAQAEANARDTEGVRPYPVIRSTGERVPGIEAQHMPGTLTIRKTRRARMRARGALALMLGTAMPGISPDAIARIQDAIGHAEGGS